MGTPCVVLLVIDSKGALVPPQPGRVAPDTHLAFVIVNQHLNDKFDVGINFDEIVLKQDKKKKSNPFKTGGPANCQVKAGDMDMIKQKTRPETDFVPRGALLYTTYKYTVIVRDITTGVTQAYDPDIDVPPAT